MNDNLNLLKVRPLSDIHLEFYDFQVRPLPTDNETVLVLAGDIGLVHDKVHLNKVYVPFLERCSAQFRDVVLVLGNHEHYRGSFNKTHKKLQSHIDHLSNVHLLEKSSVVIDDVAFVGATLWTDCDNGSPHASYLFNGMSDSKLIRVGHSAEHDPYQRKFGYLDTMKDHLNAKEYFVDVIPKFLDAGKRVVMVVHHGVTHQSVPDVFRGDSLNMFFVSEMTLDLMEWSPDLVIHGHIHDAKDYKIDSSGSICNTRVICNPRGYPGERDTGFNDSLIIEV